MLVKGRTTFSKICVNTNVLLHDLDFVRFLIGLQRAIVFVPYYVLNELDQQQKGRTPDHTEDLKYMARRATRQIDEWTKNKKIKAESIEDSMQKHQSMGFNNDDRILKYTISKGPGAFLVTSDRNLQLRVCKENFVLQDILKLR